MTATYYNLLKQPLNGAIEWTETLMQYVFSHKMHFSDQIM